MDSKRDVQKFIDNMKLGRMTRREFHMGLASVGLATVTTPMMPRSTFAAADDHPRAAGERAGGGAQRGERGRRVELQ